MEKIGIKGIIVLLFVLLISVSSCELDPVVLLIAGNNDQINYTGRYNSYGAGDAYLRVENKINSHIYSIYSIFDDPTDFSSEDVESEDLLGSFDCIGAGRTNTIRGVPAYLADIRVHFADDVTNTALFTDMNFATHDYILTIDVYTDTTNDLVSKTFNPSILIAPTQSPNNEQVEADGTRKIVKDGIVYALKATSR